MCGPLFLKNQESCGPGSGFGQFWAQESNMFAVQADFGKSESPKILKVKQAVERQFAASSPGRALMASFLLLESILDESAVVQATWISERRLRNFSRSCRSKLCWFPDDGRSFGHLVPAQE